jgi:hypothetical protein
VDSDYAGALAFVELDIDRSVYIVTYWHERTNNSMLRRASFPPVGFGLSSIILGAISTVLFILPIIGLPIAAIGIVVGLWGIVVAVVRGKARLRLCVAGVLISACGFIMIAAIARAPSGYFSPRAVFPTLPPLENRPYVPPPAAP